MNGIFNNRIFNTHKNTIHTFNLFDKGYKLCNEFIVILREL